MINPRIIKWIPTIVVMALSAGNIALAYFRGTKILKDKKEKKND
jgi:hypothetical protein